MPAISFGMIDDIPIRFPQQLEQTKITSNIEALSTESQRLSSLYQQKLKALDELKKSILHKAFSGELWLYTFVSIPWPNRYKHIHFVYIFKKIDTNHEKHRNRKNYSTVTGL